MLNQFKLGIGMLAKHLGVELTDLSIVENPEGRIDFLASKAIESTVRSLPPEAQMTYYAARPLIDGLIAKHLGSVQVKIPDHVRELVRLAQEKERGRAA